MRIEVVHQGVINADDDSGPAAEAEVEHALTVTMRELLAAPGAIDPSVTGSIATGDIEISVEVEADSLKAAIEKSDALIRTALFAANVGTPDWTGPGFAVVWHKVEADDLVDA